MFRDFENPLASFIALQFGAWKESPEINSSLKPSLGAMFLCTPVLYFLQTLFKKFQTDIQSPFSSGSSLFQPVLCYTRWHTAG